jgi:hypothetical protein
MLRRASTLAFLLAVGCDRGQSPQPSVPVGAAPPGVVERESFAPGSNWGVGNYLRPEEAPGERDPFEPIRSAAPSPAVRGEFLLPAGVRPVAVAPSLTGPDVALLLVDGAGKSSVVLWTAGTERLASVGSLPDGFEGKSIARHPRTGVVYVAARAAGRSRIYAFSPGEAEDAPRVIYETPREVNRLTIGPRPFQLDADPYYRIFFAAKSADGTTSTRTITEEGKVEYQVAGPAQSVEPMPDEEFAPSSLPASFAAPTAIHPRGEPLLWQDQSGCTHAVRFAYQQNWYDDRPLRGVPCRGVVRIPPNGRGYYAWTGGTPGIVIYDEPDGAGTPQAMQDTFVVSPGITPDGRGVIGVVARGAARSAVVYVPIAIPLGDVANAWQLGGNRCDQALFERNGGLFRPFPENGPTWGGGPQLYTLYESQRYGDGSGLPTLVTTDLFWENFAAAYNGVFILQERRRAIPAFEAFVAQTAAALASSAPSSTWAKAFAALARAQQGDSTGEAALILGGEGMVHSEVLDAPFNFSELKPRGHYASSRGMQRYFREVHYLTQLSQKNDPAIDVAPLLALPPEVRRSALTWIDVYRPFIAPARAPLLWDTDRARTVAPYAKHPWSHQAAFPLSWGIDNEVLESTVFHMDWPEDEQIVGPGGRRLHPSGVDVAAMFGSPLGRTLLAGDFAAYPRLRPVLDAITARRPRPTRDATLYQRWLDALAVEWADSSAFPGAPANSPVWGVKRLQTGLASWAVLREATILVNERPGAAEMGEGGFETLVPEIPRGYVEPAPRTFDAIAGLYEALAEDVTIPEDEALEAGVIARLKRSAEQARSFGEMARKELRGVALSTEEYVAIHNVGGSIEHAFLLFKALGDPELALSVPEPMGRIADVAGDTRLGVLEVAVGNPMEWHQIVPYFGRRQIAVGSVYSYYEFISQTLLSNEEWRRDMAKHQRPAWVRAVEAPAPNACSASAR